jgi:uncharacterized protein (TIGR02145 family)
LHWQDPNVSATNESGFTGLPGGYRVPGGNFYDIHITGNWLSSTAYFNDGWVYIWALTHKFAFLSNGVISMNEGLSVRCIKD